MSDATTRAHLRRDLEAHLTRLGYSSDRSGRARPPVPEIVRASPVRGRIVYGETVAHEDLRDPESHKRLISFSQRRTRRRSSILFFIGVAEADRAALEALLQRLDIRSGTRGGHVHVIAIAAPEKPRRAAPRTRSTS
jgi:hypothetical protein